MSGIGDRIKEARTELGWSQEKLGDLAGLSKQAIQAIESGNTKNVRSENLFPIADALQFEARWLVEGKGPRTNKEAGMDRIDIAHLSPESKAAIRAAVDAFSHSKKTDANTAS